MSDTALPLPGQFDLSLTLFDDTATIVLAGEMDHHTTERFLRRAHGALAEGVRSFVLDCRDLTFLDAGGVDGLAELIAAMAAGGGTLTVIHPCPIVERVLELTGFASLIAPA